MFPRRRRSREHLLCAGLLVVGALIAAGVRAEQADRDKPVNIEADSMIADDSKKTATFDGKVVLTQGSLVIRADKIVVQQDGEGFQHGVATGTPASFRQRQEGQEYVDGEARRIEYDSRGERVELFSVARLRRDNGDDVRGEYISYDARTERFTVKSGGNAPEGADNRVRATIMPKKKESPAPAGSPPAAPSPDKPQ